MSNKNDIGDHKCSAGDVGMVISKGKIVRSDLTDKEKISDLQMRVAELEKLTKQNEKWSEKFHREASEFSDNEIYWKKNLLNKNLKEIFEKIECMEDLDLFMGKLSKNSPF